MRKVLGDKLLILVSILLLGAVSCNAAEIIFSEPVEVTDSTVLDEELDNAYYTLVEAVSFGSGEKTVVTAGGNSITLASDDGLNLGAVDMPAATPSETSGYYNAGAQWSNNLLASDMDVTAWTDSLKGNLWHNSASDTARPLTLHLAGLTVGQAYSVQLYSVDARSTDRQQAYWGSFADGVFSGGSSVSFSQNPVYKVTGTFVADDVYQDIFIQATDTAGNADTTLAVYTLYEVPLPSIMPLEPANGDVNVSLSQVISWTVTNENAEYFDLYFGPEDEPNLVSNTVYKKLSMDDIETVSYDPELDYNTEYFWRVDVYEPNTALAGATDYNFIPGNVWSFTTVGQAPIVNDVTPVVTGVDAGENVVLTVSGTMIEYYQWYKSDDSTPLVDGEKYSGVDTDTLTINNVQMVDEGKYYCQVSNSVYPDTIDSEPGLVMTNRLIIHYPLDSVSEVDGEVVTPDVVGGYDMVLANGAEGGTVLPTLVDGGSELGGSCLYFANSDIASADTWGQYASAGDVDVESMGSGMTITFWVKWIGNNSNWQGIINRENSWSNTDMTWRVDKNPTSGETSFGNVGSVQGIALISQGQWDFIAVSYDGTSVMKTYCNGELVDSDTGFTFGSGVDSDFKLGWATGDGYFYGMIDDVKVYNYAKSTVELGQDYLAVTGEEWVCNWETYDMSTYDVNENCLIDMTDFAALAARWMEDDRIYANN